MLMITHESFISPPQLNQWIKQWFADKTLLVLDKKVFKDDFFSTTLSDKKSFYLFFLIRKWQIIYFILIPRKRSWPFILFHQPLNRPSIKKLDKLKLYDRENGFFMPELWVAEKIHTWTITMCQNIPELIKNLNFMPRF